MKLKINIFSICLSIFIFVFSVLQCNILVYASEGVYPSGTSKLEKVLTEVSTYLVYLATRVEAIVDGDFAKWVQNREDFKQWWTTGHISYDEKTDSVLFDESLVNYIKQALKEYAEENMGFWIMPTIDFRRLSGSSFASNYQYQTLKNIVNEKGIVVYSSRDSNSSEVFIPDIYSHDIPMVYICTSSSYDPSSVTNSYGCPTSFYGADTWTQLSSIGYLKSVDKIYTTYDEFKSDANRSSLKSEQYINNFYTNASSMNFTSSGSHRFYLVSKDGRRVQVFKSLDAYKNHDTGTRRVYFGSKFYEDSGAVTGTYDDLQDWLDGKYDDFWDKLKDLIGDDSSLSEDDLEKLVDKLMDQLKEVGDKIDEGNKETNNLLQQILNALNKLDATVASAFSGSGFDTSGIEAYLARILADLDYIVYEMEDKTEDEISDDLDNMSDTVMDTFSDLGEVAKTKFPLSIPWDIYNLLTMLGGGSPAPASDVLPKSYDASSSGFVSVSTYSLEEINTYSGEHGGGGNDHGTGNEDGGGGHSRGGYYLSADGDPVFVLPLIFSESMGLGGTINIDMAQFRVLSDISRTLFTLIFAVNLINLTFKAVGLGKDVFE